MHKMWYIYKMEYYSVIRKNEILPFTATWMTEIIIMSKSEREKKISCDITYMWNLKYGTNEPIYKTDTDSQTQRTYLWLQGGKGLDKRRTRNVELADINDHYINIIIYYYIFIITYKMDKQLGPTE